MTYSAWRDARWRARKALRAYDGRRWYARTKHRIVEMVGIPETTPTLSH